MNYIYKIIISIISIAIILILIFDTFFTINIENFENYDFSINNIWKYSLIQNNNEFFLNNNIQDTDIILNQFSKTSNVITIDWEYGINEIENNIEINIEKWLYLFENNEVFKNIIIKWKTFQIDNIWIWSIFINANDENKILIFSINSILDLNIINPESNENVDLKIFPHSYLILNNTKILTSNLVKSLNNSDTLKISKVLQITFFNEKFITNNEVNKNLLTIMSVKQEEYEENLNIIIKYLKNKLNSKYKLDISNFKIWNFSKYIDKYLVLFKNDEKKKIYYKNLLLKNLVFLLQTNKINIQIQNEIISYLNKIKELDINEYENSKNLIYYFYLYSKNDLNSNINTYENFAKLIASIQNKDYEINKNKILLTNIYNNFDFVEDFNIFHSIDEFLEYYTTEEELNQNNIDYILMFLENLILNNEQLNYNYTKNILKTTWYYINILIDYTDSENCTYLKTNIYNIVKLLNNINLILKNNFFEVNRDEYNLLIRNKNTINSDIITEFKNNFEKLKNYFNINIIKITSDNNFELLIENYHNIIKSLDEIILALDDNEKYKKEYSSFSSLLKVDSINVNTIDSINTIDKLISYLNNFNGIWFNSNTKVNKQNELYCKKIDKQNLEDKTMYCFELKNISIINSNYEKIYIDFLLFPYENNTISDIYITKNDETTFLSRTYNLDYLKENMNEKIKTISNYDDKYKYDFTNFFILTFNNVIEEKDIITEDNNNNNFEIEESKIIRTFKRNKLLWEEWDFAILDWFFDINYNQLQVTENNETDNYNINITNSKIFTNIIEANKSTGFEINLTWEYIFSPNHTFNNIKLKFVNTKDTRTLSYLLYDNTIDINSEIKITDFEKTIKKMLEDFNSIQDIVDNLNYYKNNNSINIEYFPSQNIFKIETWNIIIHFSSWKISEIYYNWKTLIENSIDTIELENILTNLK